MNILFVSRWFPVPQDNGSRLRIYHLLQGLASRHAVYLLSFADEVASARVDALGKICRDVQLVQWKEYEPNSLKSLMGYFRSEPRSLVDTYSTDMETEIIHALDSWSIDMVILSQWQMTAYRHLIRGIPILVEEVEVGVLHSLAQNASSIIGKLRAKLTWHKHQSYLRRVLGAGQPCTVVSEPERALLGRIVPRAAIHVVPNAVSVDTIAKAHVVSQPNRLIFTGSFRYCPNHEAMVWFIEQVLPLIQEKIPGVTLTITGDASGLTLPDNPGVIQTGFVEDVHRLISGSTVSVVPLLVGGGTRLKILEAMALHIPVVSTSKGAEGLAVTAGEHLLIADTPQAFANQTVALLADAALRRNLADAACALVREKYDWQAVLPPFLALVEQVGISQNQTDLKQAVGGSRSET